MLTRSGTKCILISSGSIYLVGLFVVFPLYILYAFLDISWEVASCMAVVYFIWFYKSLWRPWRSYMQATASKH